MKKAFALLITKSHYLHSNGKELTLHPCRSKTWKTEAGASKYAERNGLTAAVVSPVEIPE
jgi:hypothetical protein